MASCRAGTATTRRAPSRSNLLPFEDGLIQHSAQHFPVELALVGDAEARPSAAKARDHVVRRREDVAVFGVLRIVTVASWTTHMLLVLVLTTFERLLIAEDNALPLLSCRVLVAESDRESLAPLLISVVSLLRSAMRRQSSCVQRRADGVLARW